MQVLVEKLSPNVFNAFGQRQFKFAMNKTDIFNGLKIDDSDTDKLKDICTRIMNGEKMTINQIYVHRLVFNIMTTNQSLVNDTVFDTLNESTLKFQNEIEEKIKNKTFTMNEFIEKYKEFFTNSQTLKQTLWFFDKHVEQEKKYSHINLMRSYLFYRNVINYKYDNGTIYLYEIFSKLIENKNENINTINSIIPIFKMHQYFSKLSYVPKLETDRKSLFNLDLDKKFMADLGNNQEFIRNLVNHIHVFVKQSLKSTEQEKVTNLKNTKEIMNLVSNFKDRGIFNIFYRSMLTERLLSQTDLLLETELVNMMNMKEDGDIVCKMKYQIEDIKESRQYEKQFRNVQVKPKSDKYATLDVSTLCRDMCNINTLRTYAWDEKESNQYAVPIEVSSYLDIYNGYFRTRFADRKLTYAYEQSTATVEMIFGTDTYQIQMTLPQLFVVLEILRHKVMTAKQLSLNLGIKLSKLENVLNSLLTAQLIARGEGEDDDPNVGFQIYSKFNLPVKKISLVSFLKTKTNNSTETTKIVSDKETSMFATMISILKMLKCTTLQQLKEEMILKFPDITESMMDKLLAKAIAGKYISATDESKMGGMYHYKGIEDDEDDEEDDTVLSNTEDKVMDKDSTNTNITENQTKEAENVEDEDDKDIDFSSMENTEKPMDEEEVDEEMGEDMDEEDVIKSKMKPTAMEEVD
ncbi:MAG: cullin family protein [Edafosvirus sp.]|uniref:Cullin family protein n=1 Tax=Edafosvirus sp. TaxID=2487765 RepID=A0A3G4ZV29_9VIRU|nr:MAG: cullin family protein [Edafosvirus sp.]